MCTLGLHKWIYVGSKLTNLNANQAAFLSSNTIVFATEKCSKCGKERKYRV